MNKYDKKDCVYYDSKLESCDVQIESCRGCKFYYSQLESDIDAAHLKVVLSKTTMAVWGEDD